MKQLALFCSSFLSQTEISPRACFTQDRFSLESSSPVTLWKMITRQLALTNSCYRALYEILCSSQVIYSFALGGPWKRHPSKCFGESVRSILIPCWDLVDEAFTVSFFLSFSSLTISTQLATSLNSHVSPLACGRRSWTFCAHRPSRFRRDTSWTIQRFRMHSELFIL